MFRKHHTHFYSEELECSLERTTEECLALPEWQGILDLSKKVIQAFHFKTPKDMFASLSTVWISALHPK